MPSRLDAAIQLNVSLEMAARHGIPSHISQAALDEIDQNPPAWLAQSRANRTGKKAVWVTLECVVCGFSEQVRPKKWWPDFTFLFCFDHENTELPKPVSQTTTRSFTYGVGSRFTGVVDAELAHTDAPTDAPS